MQNAHDDGGGYGGFWRRGLAFFIDLAVLNIIYIILLAAGGLSHFLGQVAGGSAGPGAFPGGGAMVFPLLYALAVIAATVLYFVCFVGASGQTPGKMLLGLRVRPAAGGDMTFGIAFLRLTGYLVSGAFFYLGFFWIACDPRKQGWHDKIAGTVVIRGK